MSGSVGNPVKTGEDSERDWVPGGGAKEEVPSLASVQWPFFSSLPHFDSTVQLVLKDLLTKNQGTGRGGGVRGLHAACLSILSESLRFIP